MTTPAIFVQDLTKRYGATRAVDGISFSVESGEIVGFLGPNGAGKSTTMKILTGYIGATSGRAEICGCDVAAQPIDVQNRVGYLPESAPAYSDMEVGAFLHFIAGVRQLSRVQTRNAVERVLAATGLEPRLRFPIDTLSRGYKQRVGLAAALLSDPDVLILDEPTSGLDPLQILEIRNVIREAGARKTVLLSTHIMQEVEAICDRIIIIDSGKIIADGDFKTVRERYKTDGESADAAGLEEIFRRAVIISRAERSESESGPAVSSEARV